MDAHDDIFVEEAARIFSIGPDAADNGREVDHHVGPNVLQKPDDRLLASQVILVTPRSERMPASARSQALDHVRAEEPGAAGHEDPLVPPVVGGPRFALSGRHQRSALTRLRSASTIMAISSSSVVVGCHPSSAFTFEAFPQGAGTPAGRASWGSTRTYPRQSSPTYSKAKRQNSSTLTERPVATTYSWGRSAWSVRCIART